MFAPPSRILAVLQAPMDASALPVSLSGARDLAQRTMCDAILATMNDEKTSTPRYMLKSDMQWVPAGAQTAALALAINKAGFAKSGLWERHPPAWRDALEQCRVRRRAAIDQLKEVTKAKKLLKRGKEYTGKKVKTDADRMLASARRKLETARRLRQSCEKRRELQAGAKWNDVEAMVTALEEFQAITPVQKSTGGKVKEGSRKYNLQSIGRVGRDLHYDNELWLSIVLDHTAVIVRFSLNTINVSALLFVVGMHTVHACVSQICMARAVRGWHCSVCDRYRVHAGRLAQYSGSSGLLPDLAFPDIEGHSNRQRAVARRFADSGCHFRGGHEAGTGASTLGH